jgi:hypothetical protein
MHEVNIDRIFKKNYNCLRFIQGVPEKSAQSIENDLLYHHFNGLALS